MPLYKKHYLETKGVSKTEKDMVPAFNFSLTIKGN